MEKFIDTANERTIDVILSVNEIYTIQKGLVCWMEQVDEDTPEEQIDKVKLLGRKVMDILKEQSEITKEIRKNNNSR